MSVSVGIQDGRAGAGYTVLLDEQAEATYVGKAAPNTSTSTAAWQIRRIKQVGSVLQVEYADIGGFDQVWDDRAALTYS